ncbi:hypothetical protein [Vibrio sp. D431a]|uniref:hypothetical protein n=1 Tax=Vibrio sp. D431a TaxID=2837388 RepID=UPI0025534033|nr:hypothetical protein [Vibrio sp. D431a]MDK9789864.1 hypothetical protein [Vibrio sp. D431a]
MTETICETRHNELESRILNKILASNGYLKIPNTHDCVEGIEFSNELMTVIQNFMYFGFMPSIESQKALSSLSLDELVAWWSDIEPVLDELKGSFATASDLIVYKNFPKEVLAMDEADYWLRQTLIYLGVAVEDLREEEESRAPLLKGEKFIVLQPATQDEPLNLLKKLLAQTSKWNLAQKAEAEFFYKSLPVEVDLSSVSFRENAMSLAMISHKAGGIPQFKNALDVIRFAASLSDLSIRVSASTRFPSFSRKERRMFLTQLDGCGDLHLAAANNQALFKRFISKLHPHEGKVTCPNVVDVHNKLYSGIGLKSKHAIFHSSLKNKDIGMLDDLQKSPVDFMRKLTSLYGQFGLLAFERFAVVLNELKTMHLLEIKAYIKTHNERLKTLAFPRASWATPQVNELSGGRPEFNRVHIAYLVTEIDKVLLSRLKAKFPEGVSVQEGLERLYLPTNDLDLAPYGRGTVFQLEENTNFIRTSTFWELDSGRGWFDNGWAFFDDNFNAVSAVDWDSFQSQSLHAGDKYLKPSREVGGLFSGDVSLSESGSQVIDLDLKKLESNGVRYAAWSVLCYSHIPFKDAKRVYAAMQLLDEHEEGSILEPSRCKFMFDMKSSSLSNIPCVVDIKKREVIYFDANYRLPVSGVLNAIPALEKLLEPTLEYIRTKPTLSDLFEVVGSGFDGLGSTPATIAMSDNDSALKNCRAFVFEHNNKESSFTRLTLQDLLD